MMRKDKKVASESKNIRKIKDMLNNTKDKTKFGLKKLSLNVIKFIVNIDIGFIFVVAGSFLIIPDNDLHLTYRLLGGWGFYHSISWMLGQVRNIVMMSKVDSDRDKK